MHPIKTFVVKASLPKSLEPLREIAYNLWWYWHVDAVKLFYRLDRDLWEETNHNPVQLIGSIPQYRLEQLEADEGLVSELSRIHGNFKQYMKGRTWFDRHYPKSDVKIAYFSLEYGLSEAIPIYSGGMGVLAGDHLKSASDLGIPLVGVGILYQEGYFNQYLNNDGWQGEIYRQNDFHNMPLTAVLDSDGKELTVEVEYPGVTVLARVWKLQVGRVPLYLLDTNLPENPDEYRWITSRLYGGDQEKRLRQEMLLGIGGLRALRAMGIWPDVCHMNEGHAAFLAVERIRTLMEENAITFDEAYELASSGNIFTTHTPVAAGHDRFPPALVLKYFDSYYPELGLSSDEFLSLGRINSRDPRETFCMTVLALKCADNSNAVSRLHMHVTWDMWKSMWPDFPVDEVPIDHVTNGIHVPSWVSQDMAELYDRFLGPRWNTEPADEEVWNRVLEIPDEEIWRTHERRRERLVTFSRKRLYQQLKRRGVSESELHFTRGVLNSKALTIVFARRFATYKRADLIFRDIDRLTRILKNPAMPVQLIIAGKAHPKDDEGKDFIKRIVHIARRPDLRSNIVFIEDFDMNVARYLVQGADVWLNNPRRPLEASGTSGMKAAANGALNCSVLDGWWDEAYTPEVGWAIGSGEEYADQAYQDEVESSAIYDILEKDIVPTFYDIGTDGIPRRWIEKMKMSMSRLVPVFNTHRMLNEYFLNDYIPAYERYQQLKQDNAARARDLSLWKQKIAANWDGIKIVNVEAADGGPFEVGGKAKVRAVLRLGKLAPEDVAVQIYTGMVNGSGELVSAEPVNMIYRKPEGKGVLFEGEIIFERSGKSGYSIRVLPAHPDLASHQDMMLIKWA